MIKKQEERESEREGYLLEPGPTDEAESAPEAETLAGSEDKEEADALEEGMADAGIEFEGLGFGPSLYFHV